MIVIPFDPNQHSELWDDFVKQSPMGTFLHSRKFLSYHRDRFHDQSLLLFDESQKLLGLLPAALNPQDKCCVISHPGITYGGILHQGRLLGAKMLEAFQAIIQHFSCLGINKFLYKAVPNIYHTMPASDDIYALFRLDARKYRCDLSATIDLKNQAPMSERRLRSYKKANKHAISLQNSIDKAEELWQVLAQNLQDKHNAKPVHSLEEIIDLQQRFPDNIQLITATYNDQVLAGTVLFCDNQVMHSQYIASSELGYQICALDAVFQFCIEKGKAEGFRYFDFGISNEENGRVLNEGLYKYKTEYGATGIVHDFFEIVI